MTIAVSVHQPNFMPWLKLLDKILASDVFVAYDNVQYTKSEFHSRQQIKLQGGPKWLSVPRLSGNGSRQLIEEVRIDNKQPFRPNHLKLLRKAYGRAPYFEEFFPVIAEVYERGQDLLVDLNIDLIEAMCRYLESSVRIVRASSLSADAPERDNTERLVQIVTQAAGSSPAVHLTSTFDSERNYIDWDRLIGAGISIRSQVFDHPIYEDQPWGEFVPDLAAVDMLFCRGRSTGKELADNRLFQDVAVGTAGT
jgi:hypothetical protein